MSRATLCVAFVLLSFAVDCVAGQASTPSPTLPPLLLMWNTSIAQYGTNFNIRVTNKGRQAIVASWGIGSAFNNITAFTTRHGAAQWSQPMSPTTQAALFAVSESHIALVGLGALLTLDVNGGTVWSTWLPFLGDITGLAIVEETPTSTLIVAATNTSLAFIRNGVLVSSVAGNFGPVVLIADGVVVTTKNSGDVAAYRSNNEDFLWTVRGGGQLTQKSIAGGDVAINMQSYVLLVDLHTGALKHNITQPSGFNVFDVSISESWVLITASNQNFDVSTHAFRALNAYPSVLSAYNKSNLMSPTWSYNSDATQTGVTIDEATSQVAFATSQSLVVLNVTTGAVRGKTTKVQDYGQLDRPAIVSPLESVLFTGGLKESDDFSLISVHVKA